MRRIFKSKCNILYWGGHPCNQYIIYCFMLHICCNFIHSTHIFVYVFLLIFSCSFFSRPSTWTNTNFEHNLFKHIYCNREFIHCNWNKNWQFQVTCKILRFDLWSIKCSFDTSFNMNNFNTSDNALMHQKFDLNQQTQNSHNPLYTNEGYETKFEKFVTWGNLW